MANPKLGPDKKKIKISFTIFPEMRDKIARILGHQPHRTASWIINYALWDLDELEAFDNLDPRYRDEYKTREQLHSDLHDAHVELGELRHENYELRKQLNIK